MKRSRFFPFFLCLVLTVSLLCPPAGAEGVEDPEIIAKAALLVDLNTGKPVYEKNVHQELYPASLTKIMTCLLVLDAIDAGKLTMEQEVTASDIVLTLPADGSTANIKVGETMSVHNLLYCLMIVSANEAADILAEAVSGSVAGFVATMNEKAKELGCANTHFANPNGIHDPQHYTSAWDISLIARAAMEHPAFMELCDTPNVVVPATNISRERNLWTTNHLLSEWRVKGYRNRDAHGIKTGSTSEAGLCLVSTAQRASKHFLSVVMGAERVEVNGVGNIRSFSETTRLFNWAFDNFQYGTIIEKGEPVEEVPVSLSKSDHVIAVSEKEVEALVPVQLKPEEMERKVTLREEVFEAPIQAGEKLGTLELSYEGTVYGTVDLLASNDVEASQLLVFQRDAIAFLKRPAVWVAAGALGVVVFLTLLWKLVFSRRRYRGGRSVGGHGGYRGRRR